MTGCEEWIDLPLLVAFVDDTTPPVSVVRLVAGDVVVVFVGVTDPVDANGVVVYIVLLGQYLPEAPSTQS